ncbi:lytic transglycosylase domain-containing protein [Pseudomarimonas arenosa]|uniref:Transglycosylase SLT domain-containing protein n=1 Tax=Pseudomarimonas arenosa TaxID=2774145 RepID=A0AAW3ZLJ0_9GAMM|nr:lytic transglycosylase domain-containing protein [Pseudomarimonas arenosa]MBD8527013.1 transglycosylase SLT domain-containing protein [Pseudomarimonas arenosa]
MNVSLQQKPFSCLSAALVLALAGCASSPKPALGDRAPADALSVAVVGWELAAVRYAEEDSAERLADLNAAGELLEREIGECAAVPCAPEALVQHYRRLLQFETERLLPVSEAEQSGEGERVDLAETPVEATVAENLNATLNLLKGRDLRELIDLNEPVRAALNEWLTWMRPQLIEAHENYQFMRGRMWPVYQEAGLPEALLFGILAKESAGKVHAVSRAGAAGPLQFMPATGARYGLRRSADGFDDRFDPELATRANAKYIADRLAEFNNDLAFVLAAYNGGEGRALRLYQSSRQKNYWASNVSGRLPAETRDYVPMVLAAAWLFLHAEEYGLQFPQVLSEEADLQLARDSSINALSICLGQEGTRSGWFRALRNLNPKLLPQTALPAGSSLKVPQPVVALYAQNCVAGERAEDASLIAAAARTHTINPAIASASSYRVRSGDTLASISRRHGCRSPQALASANGIAPPRYLIKPGQTLRLSGCKG